MMQGFFKAVLAVLVFRWIENVLVQFFFDKFINDFDGCVIFIF